MGKEFDLGYRIRNVLRIAYTLPFVLASITGVAYALTIEQEWLMALLIPLDVLVLAMFVNLTNDYYDHRSGVDKARFEVMDAAMSDTSSKNLTDNVFWQGNSFDRGLITERAGLALMASLALLAIALSIPIILFGGWLVVALGLIAFFLAFFYTAPPLNLGARGLGELDVMLSFALISFFSYYVIAQKLALVPVLIAVTVGLNAMNMRIVDEMSGLEAHARTGEKDLVVIFGVDGAANIMLAVMVVMYAICAALCSYDPLFLALFLTIPLAARAQRRLRDKGDRFRVMRPVLDVLKLAIGHALIVIIVLSMRIALTSL
ncbi:MAG TPA: prenyltransferase [Methanomassiliicoccales archaeon]|nr:prenyltransferase [Methanomassiliicoccales archaeon]